MALPNSTDNVNNVSELFELFEKRWTVDQAVIFRGESREHANYMCPSIFRDGEPSDEFKKYRTFHTSYHTSASRDQLFDRLHPEIDALDLPFIGLAQHRGIPTRLLDVTLNPLVALYFAADGNPAEDGYIFSTFQNYLDISGHSSLSNLDSVIQTDDMFDYRPSPDTPLLYRPYWPNMRIMAQTGAFIFTKGFRQSVWMGGATFRIPSERKSNILKQLERFHITHATLFP